MARVVVQSPPKNWIRHQVEKRVRPTRVSTTSRTASSVRSVYDSDLHIDGEACEPSQRRTWRRLSKPRTDFVLRWHQSRIFFAALLVVLIACLSWTCWLLLLTVAPNETINYIMRTKDLDNGSFWLLVEPTPSLRALSLAGLSIVALGYCYTGAMLLAWGRERSLAAAQSGPTEGQLQPTLQETNSSIRLKCGSTRCSTKLLASIYPVPSTPDKENVQTPAPGLLDRGVLRHLCLELWRKDSKARKIARVGMKVVDLAFQQFMLYHILEAGFPMPLIVACTLMVVWNAIAVVALMYLPAPPSQIGEASVDSISDFLVGIVFPVLVLTYCLATFEYDRASQHLAGDLFPRWSFQNAARVHANPEQIARVYKSLEGLRFQSISVWIARLGNNFALLISFRRLVKLLRAQVPSKFASNPVKCSFYPRKHPLALLLVAIALVTVVFVAESVHRSQKACQSFPMCTMHAYRWWLSSAKTNDTDDTAAWNCPCRVLIDADLSPKEFSVWKDPLDAANVLYNLAASGDLEIVQLINRRLSELPDTLRRCTHLKHIALVFTHTITLPFWAAEFADLEFLHIQGKSRTASLVSLPQGLFAKMKKLTFVHLGTGTTAECCWSYQSQVNYDGKAGCIRSATRRFRST